MPKKPQRCSASSKTWAKKSTWRSTSTSAQGLPDSGAGLLGIYPVEDLIWDNTNKALQFRADILNLHSLSKVGLRNLAQGLEKSELDDYTDITTLIGIEFDDNTPWGKLTILELRC